MQTGEIELEPKEEEEAERRQMPNAAIVFEAIRMEGEHEIERGPIAVLWSSLAAGLSMGFSLVGMGLLRAYTPAGPSRTLVEALGYTLGFLIVVLGRQQLFTENTLTPVLPLLHKFSPDRLGKMLRLWGIVLAGNIAGAFIIATWLAKWPFLKLPIQTAMLTIGQEAVTADPWTTLGRAVFAGWLIALMVWLLPAAEGGAIFLTILTITYVVGALGLSHIIAGSVEVLYAVQSGTVGWGTFWGGFFFPTLVGNVIGGTVFVAILNYGQVTKE